MDGGSCPNGDNACDGVSGPGRARHPAADAWLECPRPTMSGGEPPELAVLGATSVGVEVRDDKPRPSMSREGVGLSRHEFDVP